MLERMMCDKHHAESAQKPPKRCPELGAWERRQPVTPIISKGVSLTFAHCGKDISSVLGHGASMRGSGVSGETVLKTAICTHVHTPPQSSIPMIANLSGSAKALQQGPCYFVVCPIDVRRTAKMLILLMH